METSEAWLTFNQISKDCNSGFKFEEIDNINYNRKVYYCLVLYYEKYVMN